MERLKLNLSLTTQHKSDTDWSCPVATIRKHDGSVHCSTSPKLNPVYTQHSTMAYAQDCYDIYKCHYSYIYIYLWVIFQHFQFLNVHFQGNTLASSSVLTTILLQQNLKVQQYLVQVYVHIIKPVIQHQPHPVASASLPRNPAPKKPCYCYPPTSI